MFSSASAGLKVRVPTNPGNAAIARFVIFLAPSEILEIFGALQIREGRDPPPHAWFDCSPSLGSWLAVGVSLMVLGWDWQDNHYRAELYSHAEASARARSRSQCFVRLAVGGERQAEGHP